MRLATDIGGTFTDLVALDEKTGKTILAKASSTPPEFAHGIIDAIKKSGVPTEELDYFVHGTTVVINELTERSGSRAALVTTKGFRDVLAITRCNRPDMYNMRFTKPKPFVPRELRLEVPERVNYKGDVLADLRSGMITREIAERIYGVKQ